MKVTRTGTGAASVSSAESSPSKKNRSNTEEYYENGRSNGVPGKNQLQMLIYLACKGEIGLIFL